MSARPILAFLSLIFIAGAVLLEFLVVLSGAVNGKPVNQVYFLEVDTSSAQDGSSLVHWTYWNSCVAADGDLNAACGVQPAHAFDPQNNFASQNGVPAAFIGTNKFYYETRFMFAFALISLAFSALSGLLGTLALCSRIGSYLSSTSALAAFIFQAATAALMTAAFIEGRNIYNANNNAASVGRYAFGFQWGAVACLLISVVLFCVGGSVSKDSSRRNRDSKNRGSIINNNGDASSFTRA